jgi:peptidoglycan/LPS O-acetylase OafA/YrhL
MFAHATNAREAGPPPTAPDVPARTKPRLIYLDNLRTLLITGVVVAHLIITYGNKLAEWYYMESGPTIVALDIIVLFLGVIGAGFAMGLFFFNRRLFHYPCL